MDLRADSFIQAANSKEAVARLAELYGQAAERVRNAVRAFLKDGTIPNAADRAAGAFAYPELQVTYRPSGPAPRNARAFGKFTEAGVYAATITHPAEYAPYLIEQLELLASAYEIKIETGLSKQEIPYSYVLDDAEDMPLDEVDPAALAQVFETARLDMIGDEIADGERILAESGARPLMLFDAPRVDWSLNRIAHYTGAPWRHAQDFVLFTNYHRYVDAFVAWAALELKRDGSPYVALSAAGGVIADRETADVERIVAEAPWRRFQMPAYHLMTEKGDGVTLVNIGVGPSNAKTITDHFAVLRPQCWVMIGHCGGLRHSQRVGDYVLAHAYLRDDHVLDDVLPPEIPIPPIAELQVALQRAAAEVSGQPMDVLKTRLRTGTIVTTDDRNWELRFTDQALRFNQSRAIAIDMESATIAANGFRFRVPYGVLLCVSDKPVHGEPKLRGGANQFYARAIGEHLAIGLKTIEILRAEGPQALHSRKLRAFDEPPFR
jgi:AMP nucleosidase